MTKRNKLRIAGITNDSVVDGPGLRLSVFMQGCRHQCEGCHNPQSHDENGGYVVYVSDILARVDENPLLDGVTFSGGEPFLQREALSALAREIRGRGLNVMVYTGYTWEELMMDCENNKEFLEQVDILIDGRFVNKLKSYNLKFKGSSNQRVIDVMLSLKQGKIVLREE